MKKTKKRLLALCLTLVLLLGCAVCAFAADDDAFELTPEFFVSAESRLLGMGYGAIDEVKELAVGDELWVTYADAQPAEVLINGELVHTFKADEWDNYRYTIKKTGPLDLVVRRGDDVLASYSFTVISSSDMYKQVVREAFKDVFSIRLRDFFPPLDELKDAGMHGFPVGNPFLPFAFVAMTSFNLLHAIFSFVRIVR